MPRLCRLSVSRGKRVASSVRHLISRESSSIRYVKCLFSLHLSYSQEYGLFSFLGRVTTLVIRYLPKKMNEAMPAGVPPQGMESNLVNPPSLFPEMLATVILCSSLTTLFTSLRLFTRWMTSAWVFEDCKYSRIFSLSYTGLC